MLALTRRIGESIYIDGDIGVTVYDLLRYHVTLGVVAPASVSLTLQGATLRPAVLDDGSCFYLLSMVNRDSFVVGEAEVSVAFQSTFLRSGSLRSRQVRLLISAPPSIVIDREEIHLRKRAAAGLALPVLPKCAWLHRANRAVSCRMAA
jgi:sRNA-binding carbon storage regulator CsrA